MISVLSRKRSVEPEVANVSSAWNSKECLSEMNGGLVSVVSAHVSTSSTPGTVIRRNESGLAQCLHARRSGSRASKTRCRLDQARLEPTRERPSIRCR